VAQRAAVRPSARRSAASWPRQALIFVDGPEVPWDGVNWADDARSRRMVRPIVTDTVLSVGPGVTLALANLSGDIVVRVWTATRCASGPSTTAAIGSSRA